MRFGRGQWTPILFPLLDRVFLYVAESTALSLPQSKPRVVGSSGSRALLAIFGMHWFIRSRAVVTGTGQLSSVPVWLISAGIAGGWLTPISFSAERLHWGGGFSNH
jgi:hypothetical protein